MTQVVARLTRGTIGSCSSLFAITRPPPRRRGGCMPATPDPDLALRLAKATADAYADASATLLQAVARRLARGIDEPGWAEHKLLEVTRLRDEALAEVERLAGSGATAAQEAIEDAYAAGARTGAADLNRAEVTAEFGRTNPRAVTSLVRETVTALESTHLQLLRSTLDAYRDVISETAAQVVTGSQTRRQVAQVALDRFADRGVTGFVDRAGRSWSLEAYSEMAVRTSAGRAQVSGTLDRFTAAGRDLVIVSDAPGECEICRPWEGRTLSISGATSGYPTVAEATAAGLHHANCRHGLSAFLPGVTQPMTDTADPEGDAARQEQRRMERGVRQWRRREVVALDDEARRKATAKAKEWRFRLDQHVKATGGKRLRYRETVSGAR